MKETMDESRKGKRMKVISNNKKGMEMVQVAILVAIAIGLGLLFKDNLGEFVSNIFESLNSSNFDKI